MSFYEDNKFFIIQKLQVDMAGLSEKEKLEKYKVIKPIVRERIYNSYPKNKPNIEEVSINKLNVFYKELFEYLGEFEIDYIIANLFFEIYFTNIVHYLKKNSVVFNNLIVNPESPNTFISLMFLYLKEDDWFPSTFISFLKNLICSNTNLTFVDLEVDNNKFEFTHKYPKWLIKTLSDEENLNKAIFVHLLVMKYFNINKIFIEHEKNNFFAIIFINNLIKNFDKSISNRPSKLYLFRNKLNTIVKQLFIREFIVKTPILFTRQNHYTKGFYLKRDDFLNRVDEAEILNNDLSNEDYLYLFESLMIEKEIVHNKLLEHITKKINCLEYPNLDDFNRIEEIKNIPHQNNIHKIFNEKFYLFNDF